ncbi:MAG: hypothetical protein ACO3N7_10790 [Kiritimatiellia bacterium]
MTPSEWIQELRPALIAVGILEISGRIFSFTPQSETLLAIFLAGFTVYLADHSLPSRSGWTWPLLLLCSGAVAGSLYLSAQVSIPGVVLYVLLALLYVLPLMPRRRRLQDFPHLRTLAVVGGWAGIPFLLEPFPLHARSLIYLLGMAGFLLPALLWSDLADSREDQAARRKTWSTLLSPEQRILLSLLALGLSVLCFSLPDLRIMLPGPLLYLAGFRIWERHPRHSDWVLLWPLVYVWTSA